MPTEKSDLPTPLSNKQKLARIMRANGLSDRQIADRMGITRESVNRLIARAKKREQAFEKEMQAYLSEDHLSK